MFFQSGSISNYDLYVTEFLPLLVFWEPDGLDIRRIEVQFPAGARDFISPLTAM
jgi:hypothetical protein